jgi:hypothetical protein
MRTCGRRSVIGAVIRAATLSGVAAILGTSVLGSAACRTPPPEPITFADKAVIVENITPDEWQNVEVWVNDHYRVTRSRMAPGERFSVPLSAFVAGFGQRFDPVRQGVRGVEVTATGPGGRPVKLDWGTGRRR